MRKAGLGVGLVKGKTLDAFVLLVTSRLLAKKGLSPPLTLVKVGDEDFPTSLGKGEVPLGEFIGLLGELVLIEEVGGRVWMADPLVGPEGDRDLWQRYHRREAEHPWMKNKPSLRGVLHSNLLRSPRLSGGAAIVRRSGLYEIEKKDEGERTEWKIAPSFDSSGIELAKKMNLGLPKDSSERDRLVRGIACLSVFVLRAVPLPEEAFESPEDLSRGIVSRFKEVYGLVAEKLLEGTEGEVETQVRALLEEAFSQRSSPQDDG